MARCTWKLPLLGSNQGPSDYQSDALTNWAKEEGMYIFMSLIWQAPLQNLFIWFSLKINSFLKMNGSKRAFN